MAFCKSSEVGLQKFVEQLKREGYGAKMPRVQTPSGTQIIRADKLDGKDLVYVGKGEFLRDDKRKYADKELLGATGGFAGGEQGVQMFISQGNLSFAEAEIIKQRQLTKDLITLGSLVGLSGAAAFWLRQQGIVQFELPQVSPADVAASATATGESAVSSAAAVGSTLAPVVNEHPEVLAYALAGAGVVAGTFAVRKGIEQISNRMVDGFKRSVVSGVYLAAVAAAAYVLVMD